MVETPAGTQTKSVSNPVRTECGSQVETPAGTKTKSGRGQVIRENPAGSGTRVRDRERPFF